MMYAYKGNACSLNKIWNIHKIKKKIIVPAKSKKEFILMAVLLDLYLSMLILI